MRTLRPKYHCTIYKNRYVLVTLSLRYVHHLKLAHLMTICSLSQPGHSNSCNIACAPSENSDQTARMHRLNCVFAERTVFAGHSVGCKWSQAPSAGQRRLVRLCRCACQTARIHKLSWIMINYRWVHMQSCWKCCTRAHIN